MIVYKPFDAHIPYPVYWVLAPVLTNALLVVLYRAGAQALPNLFGLVLGTKPAALPTSRKPQAITPSTAGSIDMEETLSNMGT